MTSRFAIQKLRILLIALCASSLFSCAPREPLTQATTEYTKRLERVLAIEISNSLPTTIISLPNARELNHHIPAIDISLPEFYALKSCQLSSFVAERNTTAGKVRYPTQQFVYEVRLMKLLHACREAMLHKNTKIYNKLSAWYEVKQQTLPLYWANLITQSPEMRLAMSQPRGYLGESNDSEYAGINAIKYFNNLLTTDAAQLDNIEQQIKNIEVSRILAKLWATQHTIAEYLKNLNQFLQPALAKVDCVKPHQKEKAKILRNVFYLFFIEKIQPVASRVNNITYQLQPTLSEWASTPLFHKSFRDFIHRQSVEKFENYNRHVRKHVTLWQSFLKQCDLSPAAPRV